ncbi:MAG TPA: ATP-binding protein [Paraburkholderia sp.]
MNIAAFAVTVAACIIRLPIQHRSVASNEARSLTDVRSDFMSDPVTQRFASRPAGGGAHGRPPRGAASDGAHRQYGAQPGAQSGSATPDPFALRCRRWLERIAGLARPARRRSRAASNPFDAFEWSPVATVAVDQHGRIMQANEQAEKLFQYRHSDLVGAPVDLLAPNLWSGTQPGARAAPVLAAPISRDARMPVRSCDMRAKRRDGSEFPAEIALSEIHWGNGAVALAFITDRTERDELHRDRQELAHLTRVSALGELAGSLAHELNQPLTAILSNVQAAQRFMDQDPTDLAEVREILKDVVDDSCRASEVIRRIRAFVKKEELELVRLDVGGVLRDVGKLVNSDALVRGIHMSVDIDDDLPPVRGDKVQLQQVMLNLLINAFDAVSGRDEFDRVVTAFAGLDRDGMIRIAVRDRGHGLTGERLDRIFKPFVTSKAQGLGLGLSISRSIVEMHRGRLWAESNTDQGMTFYVTLPASSGPETARQSR